MARMKPLRIHADHAKVYSLNNRATRKVFGKQLGFQVVKRTSTMPNPRAYSRAMTLAHLLMPNNFPQILASGTKLPTEAHAKTTYSKRVRLSHDSDAAIHENYEHKLSREKKTKFNAHDKRVSAHIHAFEERLAQRGIFINHKSMNVGISKKGLVSFEVGMVNVVLLRNYIKTLPETDAALKLRKKQAMHLLESLEKEADQMGFVVTHVEEH